MHKSATAGTMFCLTFKAYQQWKIDFMDERLNVVEIYNAFRRSREMNSWINVPEVFVIHYVLLYIN